jgi:hypothetical protein
MSVQFDLNLHQEFVQGHGEPFSYYRATLCPCGIGPGATDANRALLSCTACGGIGLLYASPTQMIGLMTGLRNLKDLTEFGEVFPGDMVLGMNPMPNVFINEWDLIRPFFAIGFNGQIIPRGNGSTDLIDYPASKIFQVSSIDFTNNYAIINYTEGIDFSISNRTITWNSTSLVNTYLPSGKTYSINYNAIFDYIVKEAGMERYDNRVDNLGQRFLLRRRHLVLPALVI